jgi:hypothetical protein
VSRNGRVAIRITVHKHGATKRVWETSLSHMWSFCGIGDLSRPLVAEVRVQSHVGSCGICGRGGNEHVSRVRPFSPVSLIATSAPYLIIYHRRYVILAVHGVVK